MSDGYMKELLAPHYLKETLSLCLVVFELLAFVCAQRDAIILHYNSSWIDDNGQLGSIGCLLVILPSEFSTFAIACSFSRQPR